MGNHVGPRGLGFKVDYCGLDKTIKPQCLKLDL